MEAPTVSPFAIDIAPKDFPMKGLGKTWGWRGFLIFGVQGQAYKVPFPVLQKHLHFFLSLLAESCRKCFGGHRKEIVLPPLCTVSDFNSLLQALSYLHHTEFSDWDRPNSSVKEWAGALHIAGQWDMGEVCRLAMGNLPAALAFERTPSCLTLVNRILFARGCKTPGWLAILYYHLIANWDHPARFPLDQLARYFGWETVARLGDLASKANAAPRRQARVEFASLDSDHRHVFNISYGFPEPTEVDCVYTYLRIFPDPANPRGLAGWALVQTVQQAFAKEFQGMSSA